MTEDRGLAERARALLQTCGLATQGDGGRGLRFADRAIRRAAGRRRRRVRDARVTREHIYWVQASILVQVGALDPAGLPVTGAEQARKMLDRGLPPNRLIPGWARGEAG